VFAHLLGLLIYDIINLMKSTLNNTKKSKRGRPSVESEAVTVRIATDALRAIDHWRQKRDDAPGRPEAIRRLVEIGLKAPKLTKRSSQTGRRRTGVAYDDGGKIVDPKTVVEALAEGRVSGVKKIRAE
jgi:hypothetical protein